MRKKPSVSIIILNCNHYIDTKMCLTSLLKSNYKNYEVITWDNGSKNREDLLLKKKFPYKNFHFYRSETNLGFCAGNNRGFKYTKGKYIVFLNNDTYLTPNWLKILVETAEKDKTIGALQPKIKWFKDRSKFDYAGASGGYIDLFGYKFTRGRIFEDVEKDKGQYDDIKEIFWACGAAFFVRKELFQNLGMFDESLFIYGEEVDLCWKIRSRGYKILCIPKSLIYHKVAVTTINTPLRKKYLEHRNDLLLLIKNYSTPMLLMFLPLRIILEMISVLYYLSQKKFKFAAAASLGIIYVLVHFPIYLKKRSQATNYSFFKDQTVFKGSVVFEYFMKRRRRFSNIINNDNLY